MLDVDDLYALYFQMEADEEYYDELEPMTGAQRTGGVGACWHALLSCPEQGPTATSVMSAIMRADDGALGSDAVGGSEAVTAINDPQLQQAIRDSKITAGLEEADRADAAAVDARMLRAVSKRKRALRRARAADEKAADAAAKEVVSAACSSAVSLATTEATRHSNKGASAAMKVVPAAEAAMAIEQAALEGALAGAEAAVRELSAHHDNEIICATVDHLITRVEDSARHESEMEEAIEEAIAAVTASAVAAEKALEAHIATLKQQLCGGNWLHAVGSAKQAAARAESKADAAKAGQAKLKELMTLQQIGPRMRAKGTTLLSQVGSKASASAAGLEAELAMPAPVHADDVGLTERWVDGLAAYIEQQIFFAGKGEVARTKLLAAAVIQRPAMQLMLEKQDKRTQRLQRAMAAMIDCAHCVLGHLTPGGRGSRAREDHLRFETIVAALVPDDAKDLDLIRAIA